MYIILSWNELSSKSMSYACLAVYILVNAVGECEGTRGGKMTFMATDCWVNL